MLIETLKLIFDRDLNRLKHEISSYQNENILWHFEKGIANSAGNLCIHLVGNLNTFIGREIGKIDYTRQRDFEFSAKGISKQELIRQIEDTKIRVATALDKLTPEQLKDEYPLLVFESKTSTEYFLVHLTTHLTYHLGQINYHRRLLDI